MSIGDRFDTLMSEHVSKDYSEVEYVDIKDLGQEKETYVDVTTVQHGCQWIHTNIGITLEHFQSIIVTDRHNDDTRKQRISLMSVSMKLREQMRSISDIIQQRSGLRCKPNDFVKPKVCIKKGDKLRDHIDQVRGILKPYCLYHGTLLFQIEEPIWS